MTPANDTAAGGQLARERGEADRRYNQALTALDRIVTATLAAERPGRDAIARAATALIVYLQQITAFVETKDREIAANAEARAARIERALDAIQELRAQVAALQRGLDAIRRLQEGSVGRVARDQRPPSSDPQPTTSDVRLATSDSRYVAFEDQFRGSPETIASRLSAYVPLFAGAGNVVDLGCGRGELLAALKAAGVEARGVDVNAEMAATARERGLDAVHGDALEFLESLPDESAGGAIATQVVEHLEPAYLMRLLDAAGRKLRPGAPIVVETINVACWLAFFSSYLRDFTHVRPVHPETLQFLLRASGFERVEIRYSAPVPEPMKMRTVDLPAAIASADEPLAAALSAVTQAVNVNAVILNNLMFTSLDYAAIGYKS
jgi:SAM-dependent methyltransferase